MYTPDEMLMLYNTGMLGYPEAPEKISAGTLDSPLRANITGLKQPGYETLRGNIGADVLGLKPSVNAGHMTRGEYDNFYISPSLAADLAAIRVRISQRYDKTGKQNQDYSVGTDLGPLGVDYTYSVPTEGRPMHMVDVNVPIGNKGEMYGNVFTGADVPTSYSVGGTARDVLGGELSASGQYTPADRDIAAYIRYMKSF
jgi:hypothetical protein